MSHRSLERLGRGLTGSCVAISFALVVTLIVMVTYHGLTTFIVDGISPVSFFCGDVWNPHETGDNGVPLLGALPMIVGSFAVTLLSCVFALPFAIGSAICIVEIIPRIGRTVIQPVIEVFVGIPSVVFGLIGLMIVVPWTAGWAGGTGYGIFSAAIVLAVMILPTITSLSVDAIAAVPQSYRLGSYGLGCMRWQTIWHVVLRSALPGLLTATILGMARAFGEALAVQMVIGNATAIPDSLFTPASTLTSILTMGMGNEAMGTIPNDALWSLALILMGMSLVFIAIVHLVGRKGANVHA